MAELAAFDRIQAAKSLKLVRLARHGNSITFARFFPARSGWSVADDLSEWCNSRSIFNEERDFGVGRHFSVATVDATAVESIVDPQDGLNLLLEQVSNDSDTSGTASDNDRLVEFGGASHCGCVARSARCAFRSKFRQFGWESRKWS